MRRSLSIIIPAYNEEKRLPGTLLKVLDYLGRTSWEFAEVLVVDDGSRDATAAAAEAVAGSGGAIRVRVLRNPGNRGKGYSVRHGMLEARGEWSLFSDADLSSPIEELDRLWSAAERDEMDIAIGSRALDRSLVGVHQSPFREMTGRIFNVLMRVATGLPFHDTQCGFKLFRTSAAREIFGRQLLERFGFDVEVLYIARLFGFQCVEVPVRWDNVVGTKVSLWGGINAFADPLRVRWNSITGRYGKKL